MTRTKSTLQPLPPHSFNWNHEHHFSESANDTYGFSDSSGDECEEMEITLPHVNSSAKTSKLKKLLDSEVDMIELQQTAAPTTSDDFNRLLVSSPNSSYVCFAIHCLIYTLTNKIWIQFIAFYVEAFQLSSARSVAERALQTISPELISEKKNVWIAYINLENIYGSDDSLSQLLLRAVVYNDPEEMYLQFVSIITQGAKQRPALAEQTFATMLKKFPQNVNIWKAYLNYLFDQITVAEKKPGQTGKVDAANFRKQFGDSLARSLSVLPAKQHVSLLSALASKQFKSGAVQPARNMFEAIVDKYPKQADQWNIYIDLETNYGEVPKARSLFERATQVKLSSKCMKTLLKKCILRGLRLFVKYFDLLDMAFEMKHGTDDTKEHVKQVAVDYLNSKEQQ